jgi:FlaA1/EpsC-like NDP-sugar epimerase
MLDIRDAVELVLEAASKAVAFAKQSDQDILNYYLTRQFPTDAYWVAITSAMDRKRLTAIMEEAKYILLEEELDREDRLEAYSDF